MNPAPQRELAAPLYRFAAFGFFKVADIFSTQRGAAWKYDSEVVPQHRRMREVICRNRKVVDVLFQLVLEGWIPERRFRSKCAGSGVFCVRGVDSEALQFSGGIL